MNDVTFVHLTSDMSKQKLQWIYGYRESSHKHRVSNLTPDHCNNTRIGIVVTVGLYQLSRIVANVIYAAANTAFDTDKIPGFFS